MLNASFFIYFYFFFCRLLYLTAKCIEILTKLSLKNLIKRPKHTMVKTTEIRRMTSKLKYVD